MTQCDQTDHWPHECKWRPGPHLLQGALVDALHAVMCSTDHNIRLLLGSCGFFAPESPRPYSVGWRRSVRLQPTKCAQPTENIIVQGSPKNARSGICIRCWPRKWARQRHRLRDSQQNGDHFLFGIGKNAGQTTFSADSARFHAAPWQMGIDWGPAIDADCANA